ncbi:MAG: Imm63 family immunity protein [Opitutaceae bacterium]|nr:Imm63 family immunity protein [Opitutaceae bacterium]
MKNAIAALRRRYNDYAEQLGAPQQYIMFRETPAHDGSPHIESEGADFCFVVTERGTEFERRRTREPETILYWLLNGLTFQMASDFEVKHRKPNEDSRRQLFTKQIELLSSMNPDWGRRRAEELRQVLSEHPYVDSSSA